MLKFAFGVDVNQRFLKASPLVGVPYEKVHYERMFGVWELSSGILTTILKLYLNEF